MKKFVRGSLYRGRGLKLLKAGDNFYMSGEIFNGLALPGKGAIRFLKMAKDFIEEDF